MTIKLEGKRNPYTPKESHEVRCEGHDFVTTWGQLDPIQKLAFEAGLDIEGDTCILESK